MSLNKEELSSKKRARDDDSDESGSGSPEVKRLRESLFDSLDDSDFCTTNDDLDSFMKSFEQEISGESQVPVVDLTSDSGESQPDLGFLLEASDDELGLPPSSTPENRSVTESERVDVDSTGLSELWGFGDQISGYDSFELGFDEASGYNSSSNNGVNYNTEYVALDGLFDYSDIGFGSSDCSWRSETLPAL